MPHRKRLRHAHHRIVHRGIPVGMILTQHLTDHRRTLTVTALGAQAQVVLHRVKNTPLHRLETVANIWEGTTNDDTHRVVEVGLLHLLFEAD